MKNPIFLWASFNKNFTNTHTVLKVKVSECKRKLILISSHSPDYEEHTLYFTPESINSMGKDLSNQLSRGIISNLEFDSTPYNNKYKLCIAKTDENGFVEICRHEEGDIEKF